MTLEPDVLEWFVQVITRRMGMTGDEVTFEDRRQLCKSLSGEHPACDGDGSCTVRIALLDSRFHATLQVRELADGSTERVQAVSEPRDGFECSRRL